MRVSVISVTLYTKETHEANCERLIKAGYPEDAKPWDEQTNSLLYTNTEVYTLRKPMSYNELKIDNYQPLLCEVGDGSWLVEDNNYTHYHNTNEPVSCVSQSCDSANPVDILITVAVNPNIERYIISPDFNVAGLKVVDTDGFVYFEERHSNKDNYGRYIHSFGIDTENKIVF